MVFEGLFTIIVIFALMVGFCYVIANRAPTSTNRKD
jgi:hypothetical protein